MPPDPDDGPLSDPEREEFAVALRRHLADGRLDLDGFDARLTRLYAAGTRGQARAVIADLPALDAPATRRRGRQRRHGEDGEVRPHWVATDEVFRDPVSGRVMRVWIDPTDASRHYAPVQQ
jgi:hypothetical protein